MRRKLFPSCKFLAVWIFFLIVPFASHAAKLYVFFPTIARPQVVQKKLSDACPGIEVTVFGRYKDFEMKMQLDPPDAILASTPLVKELDGFTIQAEGTRGGKTEEGYVLLSIDKKINLSDLSQTVVAVVDIAGKKGMDSFVKGFFPSPPKLNKVIKIEDLLPSLTLDVANALLIPQDLVKYFTESSQINLVVTSIPNATVGIIALAGRGGATQTSINSIVNTVKALNAEANSLLGVEQWK